MCGHVGIAGLLEARDEKLMKRLLVFDYFRGPDSTGFVALRKSGESKLIKMATNPIELFDSKKFQDYLQGWSSSVFLGHNRFATKGVINTHNAHPYEFGDIVGAHNGTLSQASWDRIQTALGEKFTTDSMALIASIDKLGIEATVAMLRASEDKLACPDAWALIWIDKKDMTINFLRNKERPLWYAYTGDFKKVFWGSEPAILKAALTMAEATHKYELFVNEKGHGYFTFSEDTLYSFKIDDLLKGTFKERPDGRVGPMAGKEVVKEVVQSWKPTYQTTTAVDPFTGDVTSSTKQQLQIPSGSTSSTTKSPSNDPGSGNVIHLKGNDFNPLGGFVSEEDFKRYAQYGCSWCQETVEFGDVGIKVYPDIESCLCRECSNLQSEHNRIYLPTHTFENVRFGGTNA